jgi:hypothetical protein
LIRLEIRMAADGTELILEPSLYIVCPAAFLNRIPYQAVEENNREGLALVRRDDASRGRHEMRRGSEALQMGSLCSSRQTRSWSARPQ